MDIINRRKLKSYSAGKVDPQAQGCKGSDWYNRRLKYVCRI